MRKSYSQESNLIAFNLPLNITESAIENAIGKEINTYYFYNSDFEIYFYRNSDYKNAIISFSLENDAERVFIQCNNKTINGIYFDLIYSDDNMKQFLKDNKKKLYFKLHTIGLEELTNKIQKFGPFQKIQFIKEKKVGYINFESTEKALKALHNIKQNLTNSVAQIGCKTFNSISFFLNQTKKKNKKYNIFLKKGNDSSIFVFDIPQTNGKPDIDEAFLRELFEDFKVDRNESSVSFHKRYDYDSKLSYYAIIIFEDHKNALSAISDLNYTKLDNVPIRLVLADDDTRNIIASNEGKLLIKNLNVDIETSQLHDAFANFGEIVECEIPNDKGISRGYGYVQFRNVEDAKQAKNDLNDASVNGQPIEIDFMDEASPLDLQKQFLYNENLIYFRNFKQNNDGNKSLFNVDFSIFDHIDSDFIIYVNENQIECSSFAASFLSPKIADNKSISKFEIKIYHLEQGFSMVYDISNFLFSLLNKKNISFKKLQIKITETVKQIISSMLNNNLKEQFEKVVYNCSEFLLDKMESNQYNDDFIIDFIILIEIFAQFGNESIINYLNNLLLNNIKKSNSIKNDQVLYIRIEIKKIMKDINNDIEIYYIRDHFSEMDPYILNEVEINTIKKAIKQIDHQKNEDKLLCKILRLDNDYKKKLIKYVDFEYVSNEAMKIFLSSIDFSIIDESILNSISIRLNLPIMFSRENDKQNSTIHFSEAVNSCFQNLIMKQNLENFTIFVNDKQIDMNCLFVTLISPKIKKYIKTDRTFSSFYLSFDSNQVDFFNKFVKSLSFFISKDQIDDVDQATIENKFSEQLSKIKEMIENKGIEDLETFINTMHSKEKNVLNYACWISLFICLGNSNVAEFLTNSLVRSNNQEINSTEDVLTRLHHKEVLKYQNEIEIDISSEKEFISNNFTKFFTDIEDFNEIDENIWRVISIRLSLDVLTRLDST